MKRSDTQTSTDVLRVAFLLGNLAVGGSETKFVRLANRLAAAGHEIHVIALGSPYTLRPMIDDQVHVHCFDRTSRFSLSILRRLGDYLRDHRIRATVCANTYPLIYGWPTRVRLGRQNNACIESINTSQHTTLRDKLFMLIYAPILRRCDGVIFGSDGQARDWIERYRLDESRSTVIHNGVDTNYFAPDDSLRQDTRRSLECPESAVVIGCVAQFRPEKNHANLVEAMSRLALDGQREVIGLFVGDGPQEQPTRELVARKGLQERIRFAGRVHDVRPYLNAMDVFVLPSTSVEVFSNSALEAMAVGVPVISSDTGGADEMIRDGVDGFVYPRHDVDRLTERLRELITDAGLRDEFRNSAARRLRDEFTLARMDAAYTDAVRAQCKA